MPDLTHLRKVAEALPEEDWHVVGHPWGAGDWVVAGNGDPHVSSLVCDCEDTLGLNGAAETLPDPCVIARHIATFDPPTVRLLLTALVEAQAMRAAAEPTTHHQACTRFDAALSRLEKEAGR